MQTFHLEIIVIAVLTTAACVLPGVFLVLNRMSLMSEGIGHANLPGVVIAFAIVGNIRSPLLIIGAAIAGLFMVYLVNLLYKTKLMKEDAALGIAFPFLFSIGVILISAKFGNVHIHANSVFLGQIGLAPLDRLVIGGMDIGPKSFYIMGGVLLINSVLLITFFKELKLTSFDKALAAAMGISSAIIMYSLMTCVSITAVAAFDSVGAVLVVALMIAPAASAYMLCDHLNSMVWISLLIGTLSSAAGAIIGFLLDISISAAMVSTLGLVFIVILLAAPHRGLIPHFMHSKKQKFIFAEYLYLVHLLHHSCIDDDTDFECNVHHFDNELDWEYHFTEKIANRLLKRSLIKINDQICFLTDKGEKLARQAMQTDRLGLLAYSLQEKNKTELI